ncbi:MAG: ferrochelatase [Burkholderiales bacterium]|nr:ferrochelatase [Burkholderiales bacterium]
MAHSAAPAYRHGSPARVGILLANLGTPDAPTPSAVRRYLRQFLSDRRVVEIPRLVWWPILHGVILNVRPRRSAAKYREIWTAAGSPLLVHTERQGRLLAEVLQARGVTDCDVVIGMRYGNPSIATALDSLTARGCDRVIVIPLYPQYAASTTASVFDAVAAWGGRTRNLPAFDFVRGFHDHPAYIAALAASVREHWARAGGAPDVLVMSFHGVPRRTLDQGDPYHCLCLKTARLLATALGLADDAWRATFQSRFGRAEWLKPYTQDTLIELGSRKLARLDVVCPGFTSDCLETLEEIAMEGKQAYQAAGGGAYTYIPCLNEREDWLRALADIVAPHLAALARPAEDDADRAASRERARALGAAQ